MHFLVVTMFNSEVIKSVYYSNEEVISAIMKLYNIEKFDLDCTYSKGNFWKNLPQPRYKSDLVPLDKTVIQTDSRKLPFRDSSFNSVMFDPPFVMGGSIKNKNYDNNSVKTAKRFGYYTNYNELKEHYYKSLLEINRVLKDGGILVFKCQDTISGGKNYFSHNLVFNYAIVTNFYPIDLFILIAKTRLNSFGKNSRWQNQAHARKYHSYFWVLKKSPNKIDYSI